MTVKEIRKITGLSQAAFAAKYEIPTRTVEDWESGARKPAPYLVKLLERAVCEDYGFHDHDGAVITIPCSDPMYSYIKSIVDEWDEHGFGFRKSVPGEKADEA